MAEGKDEGRRRRCRLEVKKDGHGQGVEESGLRLWLRLPKMRARLSFGTSVLVDGELARVGRAQFNAQSKWNDQGRRVWLASLSLSTKPKSKKKKTKTKKLESGLAQLIAARQEKRRIRIRACLLAPRNAFRSRLYSPVLTLLLVLDSLCLCVVSLKSYQSHSKLVSWS